MQRVDEPRQLLPLGEHLEKRLPLLPPVRGAGERAVLLCHRVGVVEDAVHSDGGGVGADHLVTDAGAVVLLAGDLQEAVCERGLPHSLGTDDEHRLARGVVEDVAEAVVLGVASDAMGGHGVAPRG